MRVSPLRVLGALAVVLVLPGCGSDESPEAKPKATAVASPAAAAEPTTSATPRDPVADIKVAKAAARKDGRRVLIAFGADWCEDCEALTKRFDDPRVSAVLARRYHVVRVDVGNGDQNMNLSRRYGNVVDEGIPALVVLDRTGRVLTTTKDGSFANARTMTAAQVRAFLVRWGGR